MRFKDKLKYAVVEFGQIPLVAKFVRIPIVRSVLRCLPGTSALYRSGWDRLHPFDREHGIDASIGDRIEPDLANQPAFAHAHPYGGSQPSLLRKALAGLPPLNGYTFIDLGCGKGRPLFVATEYPFRAIVGVEFSPRFAEMARANAAIMAQRYPERTRVTIQTGDAGAFVFPAGDLVLFLYDPFGETTMREVVARLETALAVERRSVYVLYYLPKSAHCFDASPALTRSVTRTYRYSPEEVGYGPDLEDTLMIWRGGTAPEFNLS